MAEQRVRDSQYEYAANSNLVLQADRSLIARRGRDESTGEVKTLVGRLGGQRMGDRAQRAAVPELEARKEKRAKLDSALEKEKKAREELTRNASVLAGGAQDLGGVRYTPRTRETQRVYELILSMITEYIGSQPADILGGAADEVLEILKDEATQARAKLPELRALLGARLDEAGLTQLVALGRRVTDFDAEAAGGGAGAEEEEAMDEEMGINLVFDRDEEEEQEGLGAEAGAADGAGFDVVDEDLGGAEAEADEAGGDAEGALASTAGAATEGADADRVDPRAVDAFWLQRQLGAMASGLDAVETQRLADQALRVLQEARDERECENRLVQVLGFDKFAFVRLLRKNRQVVLHCTLLARAKTPEERQALEAAMRGDEELAAILRLLAEDGGAAGGGSKAQRREAKRRANLDQDLDQGAEEAARRPKKVLDLADMEFAEGGHLMANPQCALPDNTFRDRQKGYEEVHVPPMKSRPFAEGEELVPVSDLPPWAQPALEGFKELNRVQSRLYDCAFGSDENLLLCAPTGAGKTNCALMTMLHEIGRHRDEAGNINLADFKMVFIAPMKSLVAEMVGNYSKRLAPFGIRVEELTGDQSLTREQIYQTQLIVCTPEKWDVITRKSGFEGILGLVIIDEIHLLHDGRGPVLESIVARTRRQQEATGDKVRLVGLSATLPNYEDVARFLKVDPRKGLFFFDNSFRPVPLEQQFIGITEKKAIKRFQLMNDLVYGKVMENAGKHQVIVFTHSRKDTAKTAKALRDMCMQNDTLGAFMREDSASAEILRTMGDEKAKNNDLREVLPYGFGIHHAGMSRPDRTLVEDLFSDGHIQVLVSTATLAWGVNLPAHTVIIKGTQIYSPEKGQWVELSFMDVMQMLGRAGRPQYDKLGVGVLITTHPELQYYLSLLNQQLPVESQYVAKLPDNLNAEIVAGTVRNVAEAAHWLSYTYLFIRMQRNPALYSVSADELEEDPTLEGRRTDLIHTAAMIIDKAGLVKYDRKSGNFQVTDLGRIASHYYCSHTTISTFNELLKPSLTEIELLRVFSRSDEFRHVRVREEEKLELLKLLERVPIPVKESIEEASAKVNVLMQAYISGLRLEGLALMSDMTYITQSAGRLMRAIFEIVLRRGWAQLADRALTMCKMVDRRMWQSMSPLRQFPKLRPGLVVKLENRQLSWPHLLELTHNELGEMVRQPKDGKKLHKLIHQVPKMELRSEIQPITRTTLKVVLTITPDFMWDDAVHGSQQSFYILVEDVDSEVILHWELFNLKARFAQDEHVVEFFVPITEPPPPQYFIRIVSDRWLGAESQLPVSFRNLMLPEKFPPSTELLDLQPLPVSALQDRDLERIYGRRFAFFNPIQTQVFGALHTDTANVFVGAPAGSGKTVCAELALLQAFEADPEAKCVYISPQKRVCKRRVAEWRELFGRNLGKNVFGLTGETSADLKLLAKGHLIVATPDQWDVVSRRWRRLKNVQRVVLYVIDDLQLLGAAKGPTVEVIASRVRFMTAQMSLKARIVALSTPVANVTEMAAWLGVKSSGVFNFSPSARPVPLELHLQGHNVANAQARFTGMCRPSFLAVMQYSPSKPVLVFVPSRQMAKSAAMEMLTHAAGEGDGLFLHASAEDLREHLATVRDAGLRELLGHGIGYYHAGLSDSDRGTVHRLHSSGAVQVVFVAADMVWGLPLAAHLVVVQDTQVYDGKEHRYVDMPITDIAEMLGRANRPGLDAAGVAVIMCQTSKKEFYKKFLFEPLPVESHLDHALHDHFNAEVVSKVIDNKQDAVDYLTWTFLYRRMSLNPNYYNLHGVTHRHLSEHLSEMAENTLSDLEASKCLAVDEESDEVSPLNLGMIAAYYCINYTTIELFSRSLTSKTKLKGLLEIVAAAAEFEGIPVRYREDRVLQALAKRVTLKPKENVRFSDPHVKTNLLLQAHFSRFQLSPELQLDQERVVTGVLRLIQACVDVLASSAWLEPALAAMELSQMVTQALWPTDPVLKQLPHATRDMLARAAAADVESVFDLTDLEDDARDAILGPLSSERLADVARFCNRFPNVEVNFELQDAEDITAGGATTLLVSLERDADEEEEEGAPPPPVGPVIAPYFPQRKEESWWLVLGDPASKSLISIKRVPLQHKATVKLEFPAPGQGHHDLKVYLMCDSYMGCDQEYDLPMDVAEGVEESSEEESSEEEEQEEAAR